MTVLPHRTGTVSVAVPIAVLLGLVLAVGLDVLNIGTSFDQYRRSVADGEELVAYHEHFLQQVAASDAVAARLAADQISLAEAVDDLEEINRDREGFPDALRCAHPAVPTYRGHLARYALGKVERRLAADPTRLAEVSARLEAEYAEMTNNQ